MNLFHVGLSWVARAACATTHPEVFFPRSQSVDDPSVRRAVAICTPCPVRLDCLKHALKYEGRLTHRRFGIFGGLTGRQRTALAAPDLRLTPEAAALAKKAPAAVVRQWAIDNGHPVSRHDNGQIPAALRRAYAAAITTQQEAS